MRNEFESLYDLPDDVLGEVIREGELRLQAQLQCANASDQRALTWLGFLLAISISVIGASISIVISRHQYLIAFVGGFFAFCLIIAAIKAMDCARPSDFCFPGNEPSGWLPAEWKTKGKVTHSMRVARVEQADSLQTQITENAAWAKKNGESLKLSMDIAVWAMVMSVIFLALVLIWKSL